MSIKKAFKRLRKLAPGLLIAEIIPGAVRFEITGGLLYYALPLDKWAIMGYIINHLEGNEGVEVSPPLRYQGAYISHCTKPTKTSAEGLTGRMITFGKGESRLESVLDMAIKHYQDKHYQDTRELLPDVDKMDASKEAGTLPLAAFRVTVGLYRAMEGHRNDV